MMDIISGASVTPPKHPQTDAGSDGEDPLLRNLEYSDRLLVSCNSGVVASPRKMPDLPLSKRLASAQNDLETYATNHCYRTLDLDC